MQSLARTKLALLRLDAYRRRHRRKHGGGAAVTSTGVTTYASDSFNRANGAIGTADVGGAWTDPAGFWTVSGNTAKLSAALSIRMCYIDTGQADGTFRLTMTVNGTCGLYMRRSGADDTFIGTRVATGLLRLARCTAGAFTAIGTGAAVANGDIVTVVVTGTSWEVFLNGVSQFTATEAQGSSSTVHGMQSQISTGQNDDWSHKSA